VREEDLSSSGLGECEDSGLDKLIPGSVGGSFMLAGSVGGSNLPTGTLLTTLGRE
jgi:hypothetical protein